MRSWIKLLSCAAVATCVTGPAMADEVALVSQAWCEQHKNDNPMIYPDCGHSTTISPGKIKVVHADTASCSKASPVATITPKQLVVCMAPLGLDGVFPKTPHSAGPVTYKTGLAASIAKRLNGKDGLTCSVQDADEGLIACNSSSNTKDTPVDERRLQKILTEEAATYLETLKRTCEHLPHVCKKEEAGSAPAKEAAVAAKDASKAAKKR